MNRVIPITQSMKEPKKFPGVLSAVMLVVAILFGGAGAIGYMAYGSDIQTVVLVNLPQDDKFVQAVQFLCTSADSTSDTEKVRPKLIVVQIPLRSYSPFPCSSSLLSGSWRMDSSRGRVNITPGSNGRRTYSERELWYSVHYSLGPVHQSSTSLCP